MTPQAPRGPAAPNAYPVCLYAMSDLPDRCITRGAQLSPSQDGSPAHTNLHTELNLQTNSLFSPLWGCEWEHT